MIWRLELVTKDAITNLYCNLIRLNYGEEGTLIKSRHSKANQLLLADTISVNGIMKGQPDWKHISRGEIDKIYYLKHDLGKLMRKDIEKCLGSD